MEQTRGRDVEPVLTAEDICRHIEAERALYEVIARRSGAKGQTIDDAIQVATIYAAAHATQLRNRGSLRRWLARIVENTTRQLMRPAADRKHIKFSDLRGGEPERSPDFPRQVRESSDTEEARKVRLLLSLLPQKQREALEMKYFEGLTAREVARRLGISVEATRIRLYRSRASLRAIYGQTQVPHDHI